MSTVSVHIVTYNSEDWIRQCLHSVFRQSHLIERVIVVDNASTDGTLGILSEFAGRIEVIENKENRGFAGGHNQAMRLSDCDYYFVLNPDVTLHQDYLLRIIHYMDEHQQVGSGTGKLVRQSHPDIIDSTGLIIHKNRRCFDRGANEPEQNWNEMMEVFGVSGAAAVYKKSMVDDISMDGQFYDEHFFAYKEDVDVAWRAQWLGWNAVYIPEALAYHERGWKEGERYNRPLFVRQHSYINRYRMMIKNEHVRYMLKHLLPILFFEGASLAYYLFREPQVLLAWRELWKGRHQLYGHRKQLQGGRRRSGREVYRFF